MHLSSYIYVIKIKHSENYILQCSICILFYNGTYAAARNRLPIIIITLVKWNGHGGYTENIKAQSAVTALLVSDATPAGIRTNQIYPEVIM